MSMRTLFVVAREGRAAALRKPAALCKPTALFKWSRDNPRSGRRGFRDARYGDSGVHGTRGVRCEVRGAMRGTVIPLGYSTV